MKDLLNTPANWIGYRDFCWTRFSPKVATISSAENPNHWEGGFITYLGYRTKTEAFTAMKQLLLQQKVSDVDLRKARRLKAKGIRWELKVWGMAFGEVVKLATLDLAEGSAEKAQGTDAAAS